MQNKYKAAMRKLLFLFYVSWAAAHASELFDMLSTADEFLEEFQTNPNADMQNLKLLLKRSYNLKGDHAIRKRSLDEDGNEFLFKDDKGVFFLSNIEDVKSIPVKFPNDINILSAHNILYTTALEANGTEPTSQLANALVLFQYSSIQGIREIGRVPVLGGVKIAMYSFHNTTYLIAAEHEAKEDPTLYQGSTVYKMVEQNMRIYLEKVQILNVIQPNDVKFWEHQDQLFLVIGTNMGNDSARTGTLVYKFLGYHFDRLDVIPSKNVKSVTPFSIGSFMYLAVANFQDEFGNFDIYSEIYQLHLQEMKFKPFQSIKTHGARDISYFKFEEPSTGESEHFLIVSNSLGKNADGSWTSVRDSVVYKFSDNRFIPFQSFKLQGAAQWLPISGPKSEFLLLGSFTEGVVAYQYDGWRFSPVSLDFGQSSFGENIQSMRAFYYFGDIFLTVADKDSYGEDVNLWKLSFTNRNNLREKYKNIEIWCEEMNARLSEDDFSQVVNEFKFALEEGPEDSETELKGENLVMDDLGQKIRDEIELLNEETRNLEMIMKETEEEVEKYKNDTELPIIIGSEEITSFELKCRLKNCCVFKNVQIQNINGENFSDFMSNVASVDDDISTSVLDFEHVILKKDLVTPMLNGKPSETLVDVSSETFINSGIVVNGTVVVNDNLRVNGLFNGVRPQELSLEEFQNASEYIVVNELKVKSLKLPGLVNSVPVETLSKKPQMDLQNKYRELNVKNMFVGGFTNGYNITHVFEEALRKKENQQIEGDLSLVSLEADEVILESNNISQNSVSDVISWYKEHICNLEENDVLKNRNIGSDNIDGKREEPETADEYIIIVEGVLKVKDVSDESNSTSLFSIVNDSLKLSESILNARLRFSDIEVDELEVDSVNGIPVSSWVLKNSNKPQRVFGEKKLLERIQVGEEVSVKRVNGVDLEDLEGNVLKLDGDQIITMPIAFNTVTCQKLKTNLTNLSDNTFDRMNRLQIRTSVLADRLEVNNLTITGHIDSVSWENLVEDSVYKKDVVAAKKTIQGTVHVEHLNVNGRINDLLFEEFVALASPDAGKILLDRNVTLNSFLYVDELQFEGLLDSFLKPTFQREWLLQDETQIIMQPFTFENVHMKSGSNLMNETINNVNLRRLFTRSLKINENTKIKHLFALGPSRAERIDVGGSINGAPFEDSILMGRAKGLQELSGDWFFSKGLLVNGSFVVEGQLSGLNLTHLCNLNTDKVNLIVGGSVKLKQEPEVLSNVNGIVLLEKSREFWMRHENVTLKSSHSQFCEVEFNNRTTLKGYLNNVNLTHLSKFYLSKTSQRVVSADYELDEVIITKSCLTHEASVGGTVNGMNLTHWASNILLQDEEQFIEEKLRFERFETSSVNGSVNGLDLSRDVLRMDVEDAVIEGEKTFQGVIVHDLALERGKKLQGVDIDYWREKMVKVDDRATIKGNLTIEDAVFEGPFKVQGKVNDIYFDFKHLLTTIGNQIVTGVKAFEYSHLPEPGIHIKYFEVTGTVNGVDFDALIRNQAYADKDLVFEKPQHFIKGLGADSLQLDGLLYGVNVSDVCYDAYNPVDVNHKKEELFDLLEKTQTLVTVLKERTFFFDYLELVQTLKQNVKAVVPTLDSEGNYLLAVFTIHTMNFLDWNGYSEAFVHTDEGLTLKENITFVASEMYDNSSFIFIETTKSTKIFEPKLLTEIESTEASCIAAFKIPSLNKSCIFVGQKWNSSRILCNSYLLKDLQTYQWLDSKGSVQVTALAVDNDTYIAVINKEMVFDKIENTLSIYRYHPMLQHFYVTHNLAEVNPVAVSSITYKSDHYLVSAGGHLPESVHNSVLSIFKFNKNHKVFMRAQSIKVDTPVDVHFAVLPSSQLALYVLTANPTKPFIVFLHKGVAGFVEETSGLTLYPGTSLYSFTDADNRHFVVISGFGRGQILKAGFKGDKGPI